MKMVLFAISIGLLGISKLISMEQQIQNLVGENVKHMGQSELRGYLRDRIPSIPNDKRESLKSDTGYFFLPQYISAKLPGSNVLEVGCSSGASVRAFKNAASVSVVEPDLDALSIGFDREWTFQQDKEVQKLIPQGIEYIIRMNLDMTWIESIKSEDAWISDAVHIYPTTLQDLPININRSFDLVAYKDYNISGRDECKSFIQRLSEVVTAHGVVLIQFWADEYNMHNQYEDLRGCMDNFFGTVELIVDEVGHKEVSSKNPLILKNVSNDIRFAILSNPKQ